MKPFKDAEGRYLRLTTPLVRDDGVLRLDDQVVQVPEGDTILTACRSLRKELPTLCFLETLHPVNPCPICVVEVQGARVLVPSCSRVVEQGMVIATQSPRVRHARKMVLELLASSVDLSTTPSVAEWMAEYGGKPERYGPPRLPRPLARAITRSRDITSRPMPATRPPSRSP